MKYLVFCPCGHSLDRHGDGGCDGEQRARCSCALDQRNALEAAIDRVRTDPWELLKQHLEESATNRSRQAACKP